MIDDIQQKYDQLTKEQKEIFSGYGLRQIKHFVELSLPEMEAKLPENTYILGINAAHKIQAFNPNTQKNYLWISDLTWQETKTVQLKIDRKEDFLAIWQLFNLQAYPLIALSHVHRDFLAKSQKSYT